MSGSSSAFASSTFATSGVDIPVRIPLKFDRETSSATDEAIFRCEFTAEPVEKGEEVVLEMGGIATLSEVWLNGRKILESCSMFEPHRVNVSAMLKTRNELEIVCRSLTSAMKARRGQAPHARWRTRIVSEPQLRWFRTTLLGRAPGFAREKAPVGPWRPVTLVRHWRVVTDRWMRTTRIDESTGTGIVRASLRIHVLRPLESGDRPVRGWLRSGGHSAPLTFDESSANATLSIPNVRRWWPHTHGEPALYPLQAELEFADGSRAAFDDVPIGFRSVAFDSGIFVNGALVFCRGVVWTPADETVTRQRLTLLRDGGFNMIRIAGATFYETESFHRLCDEFGLLVWQDMMFANMDYPFADAGFHKLVTAEAERELSRLSKHSSTAVVCGNSEIEQQAGMLGLDPMLGRGDFFGKELPAIVEQCCPGVPYIPSAPSGGDQPFRTRTGVANYFGVGAYLRPLDDARRAGVRFASECLAFSNVPEPERIPPGITPVHPAWKQGIPRDGGASWDFEDVRDHYLKTLYPVDPAMLRYADLPRYLDLSRVVTGEVMADVFGEWRRPESPCNGGIVLWSADLEPGAGWGILDSTGHPKAAYWFLKRALAPQAVWMTGEGLNGVDVHVANDHAETLNAHLRVALYDRSRKVHEASRAVAIPEHGKATCGVEEMLGHFVDASYAYRFGPPAHDLIVASLHPNGGTIPQAQAFHFPAGRQVHRVPIEDLGIDSQIRRIADGSLELTLRSERFAMGVRIASANALPDDSYFHLEPGVPRLVLLKTTGAASPASVFLSAINAEGRLPVATERQS
jgi:beta-mannosidase